MSTGFEFNVQVRDTTGKAHTRRMRHQGLVPGVIYGADKAVQLITLPHDTILHALAEESFHSHILAIKLDNGQTESVVLKDVQRHVFKPKILHVDFLRVSATEKLTMHVPLHFIGEDECAGVASGSMILSKHMTDLEIKCLPANLPEYIEVNIAGLTAGHPVHMSEIKLPKGVELSHELDEEHDQPVVSVHAAKAAKEDEEDTSAPAAPTTEAEGSADSDKE